MGVSGRRETWEHHDNGLTQILDKGKLLQSGFSTMLKIRNSGVQFWL